MNIVQGEVRWSAVAAISQTLLAPCEMYVGLASRILFVGVGRSRLVTFNDRL